VVVVDVPCPSSIDGVADVYYENESKEMKDPFAKEGKAALLVFGIEKGWGTKVPVGVFEPRGSAHGEEEVD
jgi:hypothetical protein